MPDYNLQSQINSIEIWVYHWIFCIQSAKMDSDFNCGKVYYNLVLFRIKVFTGCGTQTSPSYSGSGVAVCVPHPVQWNLECQWFLTFDKLKRYYDKDNCY